LLLAEHRVAVPDGTGQPNGGAVVPRWQSDCSGDPTTVAMNPADLPGVFVGENPAGFLGHAIPCLRPGSGAERCYARPPLPVMESALRPAVALRGPVRGAAWLAAM